MMICRRIIRIAILPREVIEGRLLRSVRNNMDRQDALHQMFQEAGCGDANLIEQPIKRGKFANVICTLPGTGSSVIVVGGHFDHGDVGEGVVNNWSGASLLPSLYESLRASPRKHTIVFIGFAEEEHGLAGSNFYVKEAPGGLANVHAMINLEALGLGSTKLWLERSDQNLAGILNAVAAAMNLPLAVVNAGKGDEEDSMPFRKRGVPTLMVHSITPQTVSVMHSPADTIEKIDTAAYYDTYQLMDHYLASLDVGLQ